jgi:hypothetical protein
MTSTPPLSLEISRDPVFAPVSPLVSLRTHPLEFAESDVLINPALVPFAKPGSLLQIILQGDLENQFASASDRYVFRLGDVTEKDISTKYGNLQLSVVREVAKAFKFLPGNSVAVALVCTIKVPADNRPTIMLWKPTTSKWHSKTCTSIERICGVWHAPCEIPRYTWANGSLLPGRFTQPSKAYTSTRQQPQVRPEPQCPHGSAHEHARSSAPRVVGFYLWCKWRRSYGSLRRTGR